MSRARFDEFLKQSPATAANVKTDADRETLFKQFQAWETERNARAQVRPRRRNKRLERHRARRKRDRWRTSTPDYSVTSAVSIAALQRSAGGVAMLLRDVARDHADGGGQDRRRRR